MRTVRLLACLVLILSGVVATTGAQEPGPCTPLAPPRPPYAEPIAPADIAQPQIQSLPPLKAVLIVGPIDGDTGQWTLGEIENMEDAAAELEANDVTVHRFYTPSNDWGQIKQAAEGAHFLFYRGHGVYWSNFPHPTVGGFALKDRFVSSDDIRQDIRLAPNAIVMLYGCFTAGTSSLDGEDIGVEEARRRVAQYSDPFFDIGAAGYYANWFGSAFQMFVRYLFQGETLGEAYESYFDFNPNTVHRTTHPDHPQMAMWLDKDYWSGYWQYNNAFLGLPDETLESLFSPHVLGNLPDALSFTYSIPDERLLPTAHQVTPLNVGNEDPLTWTVATMETWLTVAPLTSITPASFWITPTTFGTGTTACYTSAVTVTVVDPAETEGSPHRIDLTLQVVNTSLSHVHLPLILHNYTSPPPSPRYPNDPHYSNQWALEKVDAPAAWGYSTGQSVLIAILDTGTDLDHPDLAGKVRTDVDRDFVNDDDETDDDHGHGTHVSGIAAAATDNSVGVASLGWKAMILPLKVMDVNGEGHADDLAEAIRYAADNGADVINMSLGAPGDGGCAGYMQDAVNYAYAKGMVLVAAAGNDGANLEYFPANCEHVLGVAATNSYDSRASYSNYGNHVSVAAPGSSIYSTGWNEDKETNCTSGYCYKSGTSMATPHVAGLAALVRAHYPSYTPDEVASAILDNADDLGATGWDSYYGCGRINAHHSLLQGKQGSSPLCLQGVEPWAVDTIETTAEAAVNTPFVPGEIIVSFRPGIKVETASWRYGASAEFLPEIEAWRLRVPPGQEWALLARLQADPAVAHADLNYLISAR